MDKQHIDEQPISVYWWNGEQKMLDYKGPNKGFLTAKGIKVQSMRHGDGFLFTIPLSSSVTRYRTIDRNYLRAVDEAIQIFLTIMGDKATFNGYNRVYHINW
jgi:hypothetical protein